MVLTLYKFIKIWFTDQNSKLLEIQDKINITLVTSKSVKYKNDEIFSSA